MTHVIPIASGKGGVGKSIITANLGITLAQMGKTVVLVDLDLGGSNLHTCLGIRNTVPGIGNFIYKQERELSALLYPTDIPRLHFIPGDALLPATANLPYFVKRKLLKELPSLPADFVLLDLGGGSHFTVVDFFLAVDSGILVVTPEATSVLNAYQFIKTVIFRMLGRAFPARSAQRSIVQDVLTRRMEGTETNISDLTAALQGYSGAVDTVQDLLSRFYPRVILNMGRRQSDIALGAKLREISSKNLGISMEYLGYLAWSEAINVSVIRRTPIALGNPGDPVAVGLKRIAGKILDAPEPKEYLLYEGNEDLEAIRQDEFPGA